MIDLAFSCAGFVSEIIDFPCRAVAQNRAALDHARIVLESFRAVRNQTFPCCIIEMRLLGGAKTSISSAIVGNIDLAHIMTIFTSKVISLPGRAIFLGFRAFNQQFIPKVALRANWFYTFPSLFIKLWLFRITGTSIGFLKVSTIDRAHINAFSIGKAPHLPDLAFLIKLSAAS